MIKVYIASPYTIGDQAINVKRQLDAANELIILGFAPFVPLLFHFQHMAHPKQEKIWIDLDNEWLMTCDCLLRLPGESKGSDQEIELANKLMIPIFYSIDELAIAFNHKSSEFLIGYI